MAEADQVKFVLRLPPTLHRKIKRRARTNNTSMNKEITNILKGSINQDSPEEMISQLISRLEKKKVI
jgi:hypothetical protein